MREVLLHSSVENLNQVKLVPWRDPELSLTVAEEDLCIQIFRVSLP